MGKKLGLVFVPPVNGLPGIEERHMERLRREAPEWEWTECRHKEDFVRLLPEARLAIVWAFREEWNALGGNLRLLATPAAGKDWIKAAPRPGLDLSFGSFHGELMAETVLALMLGLARGIQFCMDNRDEAWPRVEATRRARRLRNSRAAILGFGNIGKWIGRLLVGLGVAVTGVNRNSLERPDYFTAADRVVRLDDLDRILPETDHLILALPGDSGTDNILDARRLSLLPKNACVYNVGRGNAIDMDALAGSLRAGTLAGAGLDVYPEEPLPADAAIRSCPNVTLLPHVSAFAPEYMDLYLDEFIPKLAALR